MSFIPQVPDEPEPLPGSGLALPGTSLSDIFAEVPVDLTTFVTGAYYLNSPPLGEVQYDAVRHIERIYLPETYALMQQAGEDDPEWMYWRDPVRMTNLITLQWGKGSGKDHICRVSSLRIAYLLLCLHSPQRYFGMPEQDTISMLNIASSSAQAERSYFRPMTRVVKTGWFAAHSSPKQNSIEYDKNLEAVSGHSDAEGQEGLNLILGLADEIDAFKTKEETERYRGNQSRDSSRSAESILTMLHTSASTRFPETFKRVAISYPRFLGSTIQKLTQGAREDVELLGDASGEYVSGPLLTWQVNPRYDRFKKVTHPNTTELIPDLAAIKKDYNDDPDMAKAKYECRPSRALDTYFKNMQAFRSAVTLDHQPITVDYEMATYRSEVTGKSTESWDATFSFESGFVPREGANYCIHADLAIKADRAGIAMSHVSHYEDRVETGFDEEGAEVIQTHRLPVVTVDFVISFGASVQVQPPREIQIRWARKLAFELIRRGFHIAFVSYDGFQSVDSLQTLALHGIDSERRSTDLKEDYWKTLRDVAYEGRLEFPFSQTLMVELESLGRYGGKVDHPPAGSKDEADALACSVASAIEYGGEETGGIAYVGNASFSVGGLQDQELAGYGLVGDPFSAHALVIRESPVLNMFG